MAEDNTLGASGTNILNLPQGALKALGGQENFQNAMQLAQALQPAPKPVDPALLAFMYFSQMAAESSKPGATALGAASTAALTPAQYLMKDYERKQDREAKLPATALQIANLIKPPTGTGVNLTWKKQNPVTNEDGSVKMDPTTGAAIYSWSQVDGAGNVVSTSEFPDPTSAQKPVTMYNQAGESVLVVPGTQAYKTATSDAEQNGGFFLTSKPTKFTPRTVYKDGQELKVYSQADYDIAKGGGENGGWSDIKPESTSSTIKTPGSGSLATYMTAEDAKAFVVSQGMEENHPRFQFIVDQITAKRDSQVGKPIIMGGAYTEIFPLYKDGEVINLNLAVSKSSAVPFFTTHVNKRLPIMAKNQEDYNSKAREVLPRVDNALELLLTGQVETGKSQQLLLPIKQLMVSAFGTVAPEIIAMETLESTSNFLAPKMRPSGAGSTSDMEFQAYKRAIADIGNTSVTNYITLYTFKKMTENAIILNRMEQEMLTSGEYTDLDEVNKKLAEVDTGIFDKYTGDREDESEFTAWYNSLPDGAVFINNGLIEGNNNPYIIKGWRGN